MSYHTKMQLPNSANVLPGRQETMPVPKTHFVLGQTLVGPFPSSCKWIQFGMGCFWGAERKFWQMDGVYTTAVGYSGGYTENPTYEEVCSGRTGHTETVLVVYDESVVTLAELLKMLSLIHI